MSFEHKIIHYMDYNTKYLEFSVSLNLENLEEILFYFNKLKIEFSFKSEIMGNNANLINEIN